MKQVFVLLILFLMISCQPKIKKERVAEVIVQSDGCWRKEQLGTTTLWLKQFDSLVDLYIRKGNNSEKLDTADYVMIVKMDNTLSINRIGPQKENCWPEKNKLYMQFDSLAFGRKFFDSLTKYLGTCIPNFGMGCHYSKFNLDWGGGGPNSNSLIRVIN
jgi:hypothetical protein